MEVEYKKLETFINSMDSDFTADDAQSALPKLVSALLGEKVVVTGGEITAICELVLQVSYNGIGQIDAETRELMIPDLEVSRQLSRLEGHRLTERI